MLRTQLACMKPSSKRPIHRRSHNAYGEEGSALPAVLVILTVITTIIGAMMAVRLVQFRVVQRDVDAVQAYYAAEGGLERARATLEHDPAWRPIEGRFGDAWTRHGPCGAPGVQCTVHAKAFGGYVLVSARATVGDAEETLRAFVGSAAPPAFENAIVLGGSSTHLTLAGGAQIEGDVVLQDGNVSRGALPDEAERGSFRGEVRLAWAALPQTAWPAFQDRIPRETLKRLNEVLFAEGPWRENLSPAERRPMHEVRSTKNMKAAIEEIASEGARSLKSKALRVVRIRDGLHVTAHDSVFFEAPVSLYVQGNLTVRGPLTLPAGTELIAHDTLRVEGAVRGPESLLYGRRQVHLHGWAGGAAQVLSRGEVRVDGPVHLTHPSTIYVSGKEEGIGWGQRERANGRSEDMPRQDDRFRPGRIVLGRGAIVDGTLLSPDALRNAIGAHSLGRTATDNMQIVSIEEGALLRGALYSANRARIEGRVYGTVVAQEHYFYRSPTRYVNWMVGGQIYRGRRPSGYVAPIGFAHGPSGERVAGPERAFRLIRLSGASPPPVPQLHGSGDRLRQATIQ